MTRPVDLSDLLGTVVQTAFDTAVRKVIREELQTMLADAQAEQAPRLLSVASLAKALDASPSSVRRMMARGCPHVRIGDSPRFELAAVLSWLGSAQAANDSEAA